MDDLPPFFAGPDLPPADFRAEQILLGHLIANRGSGMIALAFLGPQHFADPIHAMIYQTIERFVAKSLPISTASLRTHFQRSGELTEVGGPDYLAQLKAALDEQHRTAAACARVIHDTWIQRIQHEAVAVLMQPPPAAGVPETIQ